MDLKFDEPDVTILDMNCPDFEVLHYHSAIRVNDEHIYIYGGRENQGCIKDLRVFDIKKNRVMSPDQIDTEKNRAVAGTATWYYNERFYVYGGEQELLGGFINDVFSCDINIKKWEVHEVSGTWEIPCSREGHTINVLPNNPSKIFMFGGANENKYFNSMFFLDLETFGWSRMHPKGLKREFVPCPRFYHNMETFGNIVYVLGGWITSRDAKQVDPSRVLYRFDLDLKRWIEPLPFPEELFPEGQASSKSAKMGDWMIIFGGWKPHYTENKHKLSAFNTKTGKWRFGNDFKFDGETYLKLEHPSITVMEDTLFIVGGNAHDKAVNHNVHTLKLNLES